MTERARTFAGNKPSPSLLRKSTSPERGRFCSTSRKLPKSSPFGGAGRDQRERTERVSRPLGEGGCERSEQTEGVPRRGLNSLSQSLTALPAPSGREPLAKPRTLHVSREVCRHAKGPISEGAVAVGDWGSLPRRVPLQSLLRKASSPKGEPFGAAANFPAAAKAVPLGKVAATNGSRRKGLFSRHPAL